ncbi:LysR family transcriptional regulator [Vineibacter terrae]|uniref:LysR family transcriptional regulator n=1 Tax=Vineibacter terrae TaxID=2586908 RepID=A0A5C8PEY8_9HYPH|nr:LysR family transcriptional regulator [Vineibacter terrae]TXL72176.1 LysR family transcriptional regulator [Vineibacter terrae]
MHAVVLRYLDSVARLGSIRRAAAALNVASSAVNRQILKLEDEIGVALFERRGNGVRLTAAGEHLLRHARHTLSEWQRTCNDIAALKGDIHGEVRVVTIPSLLVRVVPRAIEAVAAQHPHISFRVIDADPAEHVEEMRAGRPDIALLFIDKRQRSYEVIARLRTALGAIMRPDHPLASTGTLTLTQCADYPVVMLNDPWLLDAVSESEFVHSGAQFAARILSNSLTVMKAAIASGLGIGFFTPTGFVDEIQRGELICVPLVEPGLASSEIGLFVHRSRATAPHVHVLATELVRHLDDLMQDIRAIEPR